MQILLHCGGWVWPLQTSIQDVRISALPFPMVRTRFPVIPLDMQASTWLLWMEDYEKGIVHAHRLQVVCAATCPHRSCLPEIRGGNLAKDFLGTKPAVYVVLDR